MKISSAGRVPATPSISEPQSNFGLPSQPSSWVAASPEGGSRPCSAPEAAVGGPIGLIKDGDIIAMDAVAGTLEVQVSDEEMAARRKDWKPRAHDFNSGALWRYAQTVGPAYLGALQAWSQRNGRRDVHRRIGPQAHRARPGPVPQLHFRGAPRGDRLGARYRAADRLVGRRPAVTDQIAGGQQLPIPVQQLCGDHRRFVPQHPGPDPDPDSSDSAPP